MAIETIEVDDPHAALAYVRTSVVNGSRSALRKRRTVRRSVRAVMPMPVEEADEPALRAVERQAALAAVRRLPTRQREVLVLRYWSELTEAEIADTLGISAGSVEKMLRGER